MNPLVKDAVMASFIADALSLGVHWVYDTSQIDKKYGRLKTLIAPELVPYHQSKHKGEFTHYGDQMQVLLESVHHCAGFDLPHFSREWQRLFQAYDGYLDHATKETLENFKIGKDPEKSGSLSSDLAGAARIAPLALFYARDAAGFADAAQRQTAMTHQHVMVIAAAELFARAAVLVFKGEKPVAALEAGLNEMPETQDIQKLVEKGIQSRSEDTRAAILKFGQTCSVQAALPSTVHLIAKYQTDLAQALIENAMAGGDSSARGMLAGFLIGGHTGLNHIPDTWTRDMVNFQSIAHLVKLA